MAAPEHLFVYGTLMSGATDPMGVAARARLRLEATRVAAAVTPGRLLDLGAYPGLAIGTGPLNLVHGEVLRLADPVRTFEWLDAYESIDPHPGAVNEYVREPAPVTLDDGTRLAAWVYRCILDAGRFPLIASGRWGDRQAS